MRRCCIMEAGTVYLRVKKGRGQRKNRRNAEGRRKHRETLIIERYLASARARGLTQQQMWDEWEIV